MPVSTEKSILFARAMDGKAVHQWPVAVFNQPEQAKSYASLLRIAYRAGDHDAVALLDPAHHKNEAGAPLAEIKWSIVKVPYAPQPVFAEDGDDVAVSA